jgi:hypothetical protein
MGQTGPYSLLEDLPLQGGENPQQPGHRATGWRGQIQRLGQGNEADAEMIQFLKCGQ